MNKIRLVQAVSIVLIFLSNANLLAQNGLALVNEQYDSASLISILKSLEQKYNVKFAYDADLINETKVTANIREISLFDAVSELVAKIDLEVEVIDNTFILKPKNFLKNKEYQIRGVIIDKSTGESLPYSNIYVHGTDIGTTSNMDGFFTLFNIPTDTSIVVIEYLGFKKKEFVVKKGDYDDSVVIEMENTSEMLEEVVVEDEESQNIRIANDVSHVNINPNKLKFLPTYGERDIFRMIQLLPGVSATNEVSSGLVIRGGTPDQNLVTFDGFSLYHIDHFYGVFSAFNSDAVKNIQVYKSGTQARYGGRVGGIVDITGKSGNKNKLSGNAGINFITANTVLESPIGKKATILIAARRSHMDIIQSRFYKNLVDNIIDDSRLKKEGSETKDIIPDFHFYDFNSKFTYSPTNKDVVVLSYYKGNDQLNLRFDDSDFFEEDIGDGFVALNSFSWLHKEDSRWGNNGFSGRWGRQWNGKFYSNFSVGLSKYYSQIDFTENFTYLFDAPGVVDDDEERYNYKFSQQNNVKDKTLKIEGEWMALRFNKLTFGISNTSNMILYEFGDEYEVYNETNNGNQLSMYLQEELKPLDNLTATFGMRHMYYDLLDRSYWEPKFTLSYFPYEKLLLKAGWAKNNQVINRVMRQDTDSNNPDFWVLADNEFPDVTSESWVAGLTYRSQNLVIDVEGYYKQTNGIVEYLQRVSNLQSEQDSVQVFISTGPDYFQGSNQSKGLEFLVQGQHRNLTGWLSYTLSSSINTFDAINMGKPFPSQNDQRHEIKLTGMLSLKKWQLSSTWIYGSGRPYTTPSGEYSLTLLDGSQINLISNSRINARRLPNYHRWDVAATYNFDLGNTSAQLGLTIYNVYNRKNVKYKKLITKYYNDDTGEFYDVPKYDLVDVKLLGITPNLYFSVRF